MQKKLIALAVAGLASSAAFAQSNVTIYGTLRPSYDFLTIKDATGAKTNSITAMNGNSSTIGFKGSEDLGNGLKAIFQLESNFDLTNTTGFGTNGTQDTFVGFQSNSLGTLKFGALNNVEKSIFGSYDPFAFTIGDYNNLFTQGVDSRNTGAVYYQSPTWSGFTLHVSYGLGDNDQAYPVKDSQVGEDHTKFSIGGDYKLGGLQLTAALSQGNNEAAGVSDPDSKSQRYGAAYTFASSKTKLFGVYGIDKDFKSTGSRNTWMIGAVQPVTGNVDLMADYIKAGDDDNVDTGAKNYNLGVKYKLSKRTNLQALYTYMKNDAAGEFSLDSSDAYSTVGSWTGSKTSAFSLRMQHSF